MASHPTTIMARTIVYTGKLPSQVLFLGNNAFPLAMYAPIVHAEVAIATQEYSTTAAGSSASLDLHCRISIRRNTTSGVNPTTTSPGTFGMIFITSTGQSLLDACTRSLDVGGRVVVAVVHERRSRHGWQADVERYNVTASRAGLHVARVNGMEYDCGFGFMDVGNVRSGASHARAALNVLSEEASGHGSLSLLHEARRAVEELTDLTDRLESNREQCRIIASFFQRQEMLYLELRKGAY